MKSSQVLTLALALMILSCAGCDYLPNSGPPHESKQAATEATATADAARAAETPAG